MSDRPSDQPETAPRGLGCTAVVRPVVVDDTTHAKFHRWMEDVSCGVGDGSFLYHRTQAIVEYADGRVDTVHPGQIRFIDV